MAGSNHHMRDERETEPPPQGADDAYSAETRIARLPTKVLDALREYDEAMAREEAEGSRPTEPLVEADAHAGFPLPSSGIVEAASVSPESPAVLHATEQQVPAPHTPEPGALDERLPSAHPPPVFPSTRRIVLVSAVLFVLVSVAFLLASLFEG